MTEGQFRVAAGALDQPSRVTATGDIDLANASQFEDAMSEAATTGPGIVVDLSRVSYCDSAALRVLFITAARTHVTLVVATAGPIQTLLEVSGLDQITTVAPVSDAGSAG